MEAWKQGRFWLNVASGAESPETEAADGKPRLASRSAAALGGRAGARAAAARPAGSQRWEPCERQNERPGRNQ